MKDIREITSIDDNEKVLWQGRPNFTTCLLESMGNRCLSMPILGIMICIVFYMFSVGMSLSVNPFKRLSMGIFFITVLIYIFVTVLKMIPKLAESYYITQENLYIKRGIIRLEVVVKPFIEVCHISLKQGIVDRVLDTADIIIDNGTYRKFQKATYIDGRRDEGLELTNVKEYKRVLNILKQAQNNSLKSR